jgi:amino acid adenylation domain-containing protein
MSGLAPELVTTTPPLERGGRPVPDAWHRTDAPFPVDRCIHRLVEEQAARTPDAVAVVSDHASLTYRELNERANRLAHLLVRLGVGPEARVGVCLERGVELVAALLGVLKAGGAYVPLDPAYPVERLELMLADAGAAVLVTQEALRGLLPTPDGARVVSLDGAARDAIAAESAEDFESGATPRNLAYLIYTSGSTGTPKGVAIEHRSAVVMLAWAWSVYSDEELGGVLASTSVCFDMSVFELFAPLARGGRVIVVENALALPRAVAAEQVRLVDTVPSAIAALLESGGIPAGVKTVNLGGELLKPELVDALYAHGIEKVYDLYGPSEDTTFSTWALRRAGAPPTSGRPLSNTRAHVVDQALRPVGVGEEGELYLGGMGVTRGYLGRPGLTAGRYLPDPFAEEPGARMYRTGDRVRWRQDGTLEYLGRLDHQVKIRGYRVEPGEIEAVLRQHPGVHDVVVAPYQPASGDRRLAAYLVPRIVGPDTEGDGREGAAELVRDLRRAARERLPEYMVPSVFVPLERLPLNPNGKVDRRALPAPPERPDEVDAELVLPRTETEARVAVIWAEVLGAGAIGVEDDVFTLGAHSLAVTQVSARLRARLGVELPMRELFAARTVAALAQAVERRQADAAAPPAQAVTIARVPRDGRLTLSTSQERVWFLIQLAPDNLSYNFQGAIIFRGALETDALRAALSEIVRRHEVFRTTFPGEEGRPYQRVHEPFEPELPTIDLSDLPPEARAAEEAALLRRSFSARFDVTRLPLVRWILVRRAADEHVLVHIEHHIVHDGWSFNVFLRELLAIYGAFARGRPSPLEELPLQFGDFAHYQRQWLEGGEARRQLDFWRETLAGSSTVLELPLDRPRPAEQRFVGAAPRYELPAELYERLKAASRASGVTLFATMMAAFNVLLARWSGQTDLNVGTGIANRRLDEIQGLMGMFVNSMVVRTRMDDDPPFAVLARRVHAEIVAAADHQEIPFEKLVEELQPERSLSRNPLFQAMFSFHDSPIPDLRLPGLEVEVVPGLSNGSAKFDMNVIAVPRAEQRIGQGRAEDADAITLVWEYSSDLWDAATIDAMVAQYRALLEAAAAEPETPASRLPLTSAEERAALLAAGRARRALPVTERIHERFERRAAERPEAPAVTFGGDTLSYGELNARANRLAHRLRALGVGPETRVGVCLERSAELVVAILAVLKAGGGYVPLDPAYPAERIAFVLEDAGAPVVVATSGVLDRLPGFGGAALRVDADAETIAAESAENVAADAGPDSLAYVIYTSGSTGKPKGVEVTHANVVRLFDATDEWFGFGASDVWTLFHSFAFDFSVWEVWGALLYGGRLVVVPWLVTRSPEDFHRLLVEEGVTVLNQTPSAFRQLAQADLASGVAGDALRLRWIVFGGEALEPQALRPWMDRHGDQGPRLVNMYGITETTVHVTFREITRADLDRPGSPIGVPIPDLSLHVLDRHLQPLPPCVPGELFVGGAGVARGYLNRPELTAERFVRDPIADRPEARLYRSGDLARRRADGELEYLGRADQQVKVRGFRIETGEIVAALATHPSVAEAVVVARGDDGEKRLVAYVVARADAPPPVAELRTHVSAILPDYMVPAAFVTLDALPLTEHGKLDGRALPELDEAGTAAGGAYVAPATPVEEVLAGIWAEVLRRDRVGTADRFFEIGGHSLLATRVVSRVRAVFDVELPLRVLFERPTVAELAEAVEALRRVGAPALPPVLPADRDRPLPLSFAQERLWFLDRLEPGSALYNLRVPLRLEGALDVAALERALGEIVRRHDVLRTTFAEAEGAPVQVVAPFAGFPLPVEEVTGVDATAREAEALRRASAEGARPFDLERGPLFRALLLRMAPDDHLLLLWMHHAVSDGWSTGVLLRELSALYAAYREGGHSPLSELAVQYADYAAWQREQLRGDVLERDVAFWRGRLAGALALLELPTDRPRPAVQTHRGSREPVVIAEELREGLEALARREGATLYMVLLGAFQLLLSKYAGIDDVVVGTPIAGRTRAEAEPLIGLFVNTLVMRTGLSGDPSFRELLGRVRETTLAAYEHQDVPFERLVEALQPERSLSHGALFQVLFQLQQQALDGPAGALPGVRMERAALEIPHAKFDLTLDLASGPGGLRGTMEYATDLFDRATVSRMLGHFARVLEQVAADPGLRLSDVALMGADERRRVVEAWNPTDASFSVDRGIARIFEAQAAAAPGAVAVMCGDESLTYGELNERANRLARVLLRRGVGVESRVGVCLERSLEMVVSLLAVLKAGGAYVPLDPAYPAERLEGMLADAGVDVVVAQAALLDRLPHGRKLVVLERVRDAFAGEEASDLDVEVSGGHLCYVIYTSGSTGTPKGVAVEHRSVARLVCGASYVDLGPDEVILQAAPVSFDASTLEIWGALLNGGRMALVPSATPSLEELGRAITRHGVTTMWLTAGLFQVMVQERLEELSGVRQLLTGGDVLPVEQVRKTRERFPHLRLINGYGPTENTTFTCCHTVGDEWSGGPVPIGSPISGTRVYVLDESLRPVPIGIPGELYAGGDGVTRGYLGRPAATAERFVPDAFARTPGARLYRTGDRVRWLADGTLEFMGRLDAQVKIRGFRIEPGEVEAVLQREPGVRECVVAVREDAPGEKRLVAYVVGGAEAGELREALRRSLPEWMVPAAFVALDALPLTPNGKVDRKALPAPDSAPDEEAYVAPRTPVETEMAAIWAEVLGHERVGATDDFFVALGGHSLAATRVVSRVRAALGVDLPVRALFESPTVEALARAVEASRAGGAAPARVAKIPRAARVALAGAIPPASSDAG